MLNNKNQFIRLILISLILGLVSWGSHVTAQLADYSSQTDSLISIELEQTGNQFATETTEESAGLGWSLFIPIMVIAVCGSVVYLCYQAMLAWNGYWKSMALAPLLILGVWLAVIVLAKFADATSHELWPFEVFSWAMITTIYMVVLMTAKRTFDKAAEQKN